jgi:hypothetical protein
MKNKTLKNLTVISGFLLIIGIAWLCVQLITGFVSYFLVGTFLFTWYWLIPLVLGFIMALLFAGKWFDKFKK